MPTIIAGRVITILDVQNTSHKSKIRESRKDLKDLGKEAKTAGVSLKGMFAGAVAGAALLGLKAFVFSAVKLAAALQTVRISINTMVGSGKAGTELIKQIREMASITPFTTMHLIAAAKALLAFGVASNKVTGTLRTLGDVSAGTGKDLKELAIIYGKIRSTGRLMGQELNQLIDAGFNPLQEISEKTGRSMSDLKEDMRKGLVTFDMVEESFKRVTAEGGKFFNLMEKQSAALEGKLSTLQDAVDNLKITAGNVALGPLSDLIGLTTKGIEAADRIFQGRGTTKDKLLVGGAAVSVVVAGFAAHTVLIGIIAAGVRLGTAGKGAGALPAGALGIGAGALADMGAGPAIIALAIGKAVQILLDARSTHAEQLLHRGFKAADLSPELSAKIAKQKADRRYGIAFRAEGKLMNIIFGVRDRRARFESQQINRASEDAQLKRAFMHPGRFGSGMQPIKLDFDVEGAIRSVLSFEKIFAGKPTQVDEIDRMLNNFFGDLDAIAAKHGAIDKLRAELREDPNIDKLPGAFAQGSVEAWKVINQRSSNTPEKSIARTAKQIKELLLEAQAIGWKIDAEVALP